MFLDICLWKPYFLKTEKPPFSFFSGASYRLVGTLKSRTLTPINQQIDVVAAAALIAPVYGCKWAGLARKLVGEMDEMDSRKAASVVERTPNPMKESDLPYYHYDSIGDFEMRWGFEGEGKEERVDLEFTLYSDIFVGIGFDCTSSKMCDMVVGNGGGRNSAFVEDYFEVEGDREPHTDEELGGTNDLEVVELKYENYASVLRFKRKLDTGDKWDAVIKKGYMDLVYAWCEEPFCVDTHSAHAPGSWNIISVDMSGTNSKVAKEVAMGRGKGGSDDADCRSGSEDLCSCSQLMKRGVIPSFDECTQEAAVDYCKQHGACGDVSTY
ncbi:hypothetical protein TrCOL_g12885 [Triparma columacea]|uniref:DOMON domain-containing protein n=1 Tax=Triparma columacea TaxID=722753 RepID=A0A9W7L3R7_9STRA|nr:hypothetical protein TrCOL_g12885 [Triparma columacea]